MGVLKPQLEVGGRTMLAAVLAATADAAARVVVGPPQPVPPGVVLLREDPPGGGPVAALRAGLAAVATDVVAALAGDLPFLTAELIGDLRGRLTGDGVLVVDETGQDQLLLGVWRTRGAAHRPGRRASGPTSLRRVLAPLAVRRLRPAAAPRTARSLDRLRHPCGAGPRAFPAARQVGRVREPVPGLIRQLRSGLVVRKGLSMSAGRRALLLLPLITALAACTGGGSSGAGSSSSAPSSASTSAAPSSGAGASRSQPSAEGSGSSGNEPSEASSFPADTSPDGGPAQAGATSDPSGQMHVTGIRYRQHPGYVRVVIDLNSAGVPEWTARYTEKSGPGGGPVDIAGDAFLRIS